MASPFEKSLLTPRSPINRDCTQDTDASFGEEDAMYKAGMMLNGIKTIIIEGKGKVSANNRDKIVEDIDEILSILFTKQKEAETQTKMAQDIEEIKKKILNNEQPNMNKQRSYSNVTQEKKYSLIVSSKKSEKSPEDIEKYLKQKLRLSSMGISVCSTRRLREKGLLVTCPSVADAQLFVQTINERHSDMLEATLLKKRRPHIILKNIAADYDLEDLTDDIVRQNSNLRDLSLKPDDVIIKKTIKLKGRFEQKHIIIETTSEARRRLVENGLIYVGYQRVHAVDADPVMQCYHCLGMGHTSITCLNKNGPPVCSHCACAHQYGVCDRRNDPPVCVNCKRSKERFNTSMRYDHSAMDKKEYKLLTSHIIKDPKDRSTIKPQHMNFLTDVTQPSSNADQMMKQNFVFTSQIPKEPFKYNNTYTFAGQNNISISPSSIPNPNPSTLGMKIDHPFQPYGSYIFPIQNFPSYQTLYPTQVTLPQIPVSLENSRTMSDQMKMNEESKTEHKLLNSEDNFKKEKEKILQPFSAVTGEKDNSKIVEESSSDNPIINSAKNAPLKIDKQTGPGGSSYVKLPKVTETASIITNSPASTNTLTSNNGSYTLKTSIPFSKIDMRSIQSPLLNATIRNKPIDHAEKSNEMQSTAHLQTKSLDNQILNKNDVKQNFFHQGNAVGHPHNIIKMLVPSQSNEGQGPGDNSRAKPQIISDILLKPIDTFHKASESLGENIVGPRNIPISDSNMDINTAKEDEGFCKKLDNHIKSTLENPQLDKDVKKQFVFIPNPHVANKLLLSISSKQASNPIVLPKIQSQEECKMNNPFAIPKVPDRFREMTNASECSPENNKVVALKRLHHENYDENDFENLITENQIYGNKIVIKEKSQPFVHPNSLLATKNKLTVNETVTTKDLSTKANMVVQPNFLYVSNVKFQPNASNIMLINNNTLKTEPAIQKSSDVKSENVSPASSQNKVVFGTQTFRTVNPITHTVSYVKTNDPVETSTQSTVLQTLLTKPNIKSIAESHIGKSNSQNMLGQLVNNKIGQLVYQVPMIIERNSLTNRAVNVVKPTYLNSELAMLLTKTKNDQMDTSNASLDIDGKYVAIRNDEAINETGEENELKALIEEVSVLDMAEKRKLLRDKRRLLFSKKMATEEEETGHREKEKYLCSQNYYYEDDSEDSEDMSEDECAQQSDLKDTKMPLDTGEGKLEFLNMFGLTTRSIKKEKELNNLERSLQMDLVTLANVAAQAERITEQINNMEGINYGEQPYSLPIPTITENPINNESIEKITDKIVFMNELKLGMVPHSYKMEHELMWQHVLKDRKKRNGNTSLTNYLERTFKAQNFSNFVNNNNIPIDLHTRDQLETMTKIKQSVLENNNLIKLKLDKLNHTNERDSDIPFLAEKNFSEIKKLSHMANKSLTILRVSQDLKESLPSMKHSTNYHNAREMHQKQLKIQTNLNSMDSNLSQLNIPKIVSLKSTEIKYNNVDILPAIPMDEPRNSAGGIVDKYKLEDTKPFVKSGNMEIQTDISSICSNTQMKMPFQWPGIQAVLESYKTYSIECDLEKQRLIQRNESLRNDIALQENDVACLGAHLRLLLTEQQICEDQWQSLQRSIDVLNNCISQILA